MRCLALLATALLLCVSAAHADSLADLQQPSSTIPGCVNDSGPLGTGSGVVEPTCEGKAALAEWNEHAAAVNTARDRPGSALAPASSNRPARARRHWPSGTSTPPPSTPRATDLPDRADPQAVVNALNACAAAADAMTRLYHAAEPRPRGLADVLAWMRPWFERQRLAIPDLIGTGFRTLAGALAQPGILRQDRIAIYRQAAVFATRESELAAELGGEVQRQTDTAVWAAHTAALQAARAVENSRAQPDPAAAIAAAAGPGHPAVAQEQTRQLNQSLAAHPGQDGYVARTRRALAAIPDAFLWIGGIALFLVAVGFRPLAVRLGTAGAIESSLLLLVTLPLSWLPLALLHAVTGWPDGWIALILWLALIAVLLGCGPRFLPSRLRRVWSSLFASAPSRPTAPPISAGPGTPRPICGRPRRTTPSLWASCAMRRGMPIGASGRMGTS